MSAAKAPAPAEPPAAARPLRLRSFPDGWITELIDAIGLGDAAGTRLSRLLASCEARWGCALDAHHEAYIVDSLSREPDLIISELAAAVNGGARELLFRPSAAMRQRLLGVGDLLSITADHLRILEVLLSVYVAASGFHKEWDGLERAHRLP